MTANVEPQRVVLVGFMASGKSTVGRHLAKRLGWRFSDMDESIAASAGRSISELFAAEGEAAFRAREANEAQRLLGERQVVVASGGGAFAEAGTRELLRTNAFTVYLQCALAEIERRIGDGARRPLARNRGIIPDLLKAREDAYAMADWRIDTTSVDAATVARRIAETVQRATGNR